MGDLVSESLLSAVFTAVIVVLLCLAPLVAARGRTVIGVLLLLVPLGFIADVLVRDHSTPSKSEVVNPFPVVNPPVKEGVKEEGPHLFVLETVEAPPSHYHLFLAAIVAIPALLILLRRNRQRAAPNAVWHAMLVSLFVLAVRIGLEKSGAPAPVYWGVGLDGMLLVILPFFGLYCGRQGHYFGMFVRMLVLLALLQRLAIVVWSYFATMHQLGSHFDMHLLETRELGGLKLPIFGVHQPETDFDRWLWPVLIPQLTVWIVLTVIAGIVLGTLPRWWSSRKVVVVVGPRN
jgi:hypothetical protein